MAQSVRSFSRPASHPGVDGSPESRSLSKEHTSVVVRRMGTLGVLERSMSTLGRAKGTIPGTETKKMSAKGTILGPILDWIGDPERQD